MPNITGLCRFATGYNLSRSSELYRSVHALSKLIHLTAQTTVQNIIPKNCKNQRLGLNWDVYRRETVNESSDAGLARHRPKNGASLRCSSVCWYSWAMSCNRNWTPFSNWFFDFLYSSQVKKQQSFNKIQLYGFRALRVIKQLGHTK